MSQQTHVRFFFGEDEYWSLSYDFYINMWTRANALGFTPTNVQEHRDYVQMYMGR